MNAFEVNRPDESGLARNLLLLDDAMEMEHLPSALALADYLERTKALLDSKNGDYDSLRDDDAYSSFIYSDRGTARSMGVIMDSQEWAYNRAIEQVETTVPTPEHEQRMQAEFVAFHDKIEKVAPQFLNQAEELFALQAKQKLDIHQKLQFGASAIAIHGVAEDPRTGQPQSRLQTLIAQLRGEDIKYVAFIPPTRVETPVVSQAIRQADERPVLIPSMRTKPIVKPAEVAQVVTPVPTEPSKQSTANTSTVAGTGILASLKKRFSERHSLKRYQTTKEADSAVVGDKKSKWIIAGAMLAALAMGITAGVASAHDDDGAKTATIAAAQQGSAGYERPIVPVGDAPQTEPQAIPQIEASRIIPVKHRVLRNAGSTVWQDAENLYDEHGYDKGRDSISDLINDIKKLNPDIDFNNMPVGARYIIPNN